MIQYSPIGTIHSPFKNLEGMPIQPKGARSIQGSIRVLDQFIPGLKDLEGFSHLQLIYHLHRSNGYELEVIPFLDTAKRGLFATRAPKRPNPIGLSTVRLLSIEGCLLTIADVDILDGTPLLDIKPFVPAFDMPDSFRTGWLETVDEEQIKRHSDDRFSK